MQEEKHMTIPSQDLLKCRECGEEKPLSEYYTRKNGKTHQHKCKKCVIARNSAYKKNPAPREAENKAQRAKRTRVKDAVFAAYGGYKCACCGETEPLFLTIDHVNNDGAKFRKETFGQQNKGGGYHTYLWLARNGFPEGYQVLCSNCNHGKRMNNGVCPHQQVRCNDQSKDVGPSGPKRTAPHLQVVNWRG